MKIKRARPPYLKFLPSCNVSIKIIRVISSTVFEVKNIMQTKKEAVHAPRMLTYPMWSQKET